MITHRLGRSDVEVGPAALGTAALGGLYTSVSEDDADRLIAAALERGINYFDTAPQYGHGTSERRLGRALRDVPRDTVTVATKVGRLVVDDPSGNTPWFADAPPSSVVFAFDRDSILRSLDESLQRLGLDRVDVISIHDPDDHADQAIEEAYPTLHELREQGVVRAIGVGMNQSAIPTRFVNETEIDYVLLAGRYTLLEQPALDDLIPAARRSGVSIVIGGAFNSGLLVDPDPTDRVPMYNYVPAPDDVLAHARLLRDICASHGVALPHAALRFCRREPAVTTVLLGSRSVAELDQNLAWMNEPVPAALWDELASRGLISELEVDRVSSDEQVEGTEKIDEN